MRVLLVDDDAINRLILKKIFEKSSDEVVVAKNGVEALLALQSDCRFNVILTDIMMPQMDGVELLTEIKKRSDINTIPVIGFTSGDVEFYRKNCKEKFDSLVSKPMDFWDLYDLAKTKATKELN